MAEIGDAIEEFKKLPPAAKMAIGIGAAGALGLGLYMRYKAAKAGNGTTAADQSNATDTPGGVSDTGGYSGPPTVVSTTPTPGPQGPPGPTGPAGPPYKPPTPPPKPLPGGGDDDGGGSKGNPPPPKPKMSYYTVQHGDSLSGIAAKLHLKGGWQALYNLNRGIVGSNPNLIYAGTRLNITGLR